MSAILSKQTVGGERMIGLAIRYICLLQSKSLEYARAPEHKIYDLNDCSLTGPASLWSSRPDRRRAARPPEPAPVWNW